MQHDDDDSSIVQRVLSGDTEAFRMLVDRYGDRLYNFCRVRLGDDSDAEDAVQDVFIRAFRSLRSFDTGRSWSSWLFAIAANRVKSRYAGNASMASLEERAGIEAEVMDEAATRSADPAGLALDAIAAESLRDAVATLPAVYRGSVELFYFAGLGVADVARSLGLGEEAVKSRLFRARKELAKILENNRQPQGNSKGSS